jgi:hypothetical protein
MIEKVKKIVSSPLFACACASAIGLILLMEKHPLYAGIAFGFAGCKFLDAFKKI